MPKKKKSEDQVKKSKFTIPETIDAETYTAAGYDVKGVIGVLSELGVDDEKKGEILLAVEGCAMKADIIKAIEQV